MDPILTAVYKQLARDHRASVDDILVQPKLRTEFLSNCRERLGKELDEETLLRRLCNLRKRSKLPRTDELAPAAVEAQP